MAAPIFISLTKLGRIVALVQWAGIVAMLAGAALVILSAVQFAGDAGLLSLIGMVLGGVILFAGWRVTWMLVRLRSSAGAFKAMLRSRAFDDAAARARKVN